MAETKDGAESSIFSFRGFGTVGLVHSSEGKADYINSDFQKRGAGHSRNWSHEVDSRAGVQMNARLSPQTSAVVQVVSEQREDGSYRPEIEWANVKYEVTPDLSIRAGRFVLPSFMQADSRKVGYAYPWVRPPVEVYNLIPATRTDGIDIHYQARFGDIKNTLELGVGKGSGRVPEGRIEWKDGWGLMDTIEYGNATLRFSYIRTKLTVDGYKPLFDGFRNFRQLDPRGVARVEKYEVDDSLVSFFSMGAAYDPGKWFVTGEWGTADFHSLLGKREAWFLSSGFRAGKFTPYVTYSRAILKSSTTAQGLNLPPGYPELVYEKAAALNAELNYQMSLAPVQRTVSAGVRWDFASNAALKLQYDHTRLGKGSSGTLDNMQPGYRPGGHFNVVSMTLDFLF